MSKLKILMVSSEVEPFAKTGGLGDVVGALPKALNKEEDVECRVIMPLYSLINPKFREKMKYLGYIYVDLNWRHQYCGIFQLRHDGVTYYFIDNEFYYKNSKIYDNMDLEKFSFLDVACFEVCKFIKYKPDIIHIHDWQTGPIACLLESKYKHEDFFKKTKCVYTIHNLQYQGAFERGHVLDMLPINGDYYGDDNPVSFMKLGIVYSSRITTVSPSYRNEILTSYYGEGLDGMLNYYSFKLDGILNGIDTKTYNSELDNLIYHNFAKEDYVEGKKENKKALLEELGLHNDLDAPVISIITRLASQKGIELVLYVLDRLLQKNVNVVVLGSGEKKYEESLNAFACKYPTKCRAILKFDNAMAHKIYAASDLFLMPSAFEPCGLAQMICLQYQTLPLVRECGGLKDSIIPYNEKTHEGNGFSFTNFNGDDFYNTIEYALNIYNQKNKWNEIITNGFKYDFSWQESAKKYLAIYLDIANNGK